MLILTSLREGTGNAVTAARLAERIPAAHCSLLDINALPDAEALREHVCECHIGLVLGIHAYRAGRLLVGSGVPFAIVLGGTDMNVMLHDEPKRRVMLDAIAQVMLRAPCCTQRTSLSPWPVPCASKHRVRPLVLTRALTLALAGRSRRRVQR